MYINIFGVGPYNIDSILRQYHRHWSQGLQDDFPSAGNITWIPMAELRPD